MKLDLNKLLKKEVLLSVTAVNWTRQAISENLNSLKKGANLVVFALDSDYRVKIDHGRDVNTITVINNVLSGTTKRDMPNLIIFRNSDLDLIRLIDPNSRWCIVKGNYTFTPLRQHTLANLIEENML